MMNKYKIAWSSGLDKANKNMRENNRKTWNKKDKEIAIKEFNRIYNSQNT